MPNEKIEVRYKTIAYESADEVPRQWYHKYIVYTDSLGNEYYARGGFEPGIPLRIDTDYGVYAPGTPDYRNPLTGIDPSELIAQAPDLSDYWDIIKAAMDDIEAESHWYHPGQNSNSATDTALDRAGLPQPVMDGRDDYISPGSGNILSPAANDQDRPLPEWVPEAYDPFNDAKPLASPLVIDLSPTHTGLTLTTYNTTTTMTFFDIKGTGYATQTAWISGSTGLLARDLNANGTIDSVNELFGSPTVDGFAKLALLDSDHNIRIDQYDSAWSSLTVWQDTDGDAVTDSGELHSLSSLNITSIDLAGVTSSTSTINGNPISHISTVSFSNGASATIGDAWFVHDSINSYYTGEYEFNDAAMVLPDLRGFGTLPDLHIAMSLDSDLLEMVQDFAAGFEFESFADPEALNDAVTAIMYKWAGVENVDPGSRGAVVDARKLEFLEHLFGEGFVSPYFGSMPYWRADTFLEKSFHIASENIKAGLIAQLGAAELFTDAGYDLAAGTITGDVSLSQAAIDDLVNHAPAPGSDNIAFWLSVTAFLDTVVGLSNLSGTEEGWLDDAIASTDIALSWNAVEDLYEGINPGSTTSATSGDDTLSGTGAAATIDGLAGHDAIGGTNGNDVLYGNDGNDTIHGYQGADVIHGDAGNDIIYGEGGDDTLVGGDGNDIIDTGSGNDTVYGGLGGNTITDGGYGTTYVFGGGNDSIHDFGGTDQVVLPAGITLGDLTFLRTSSNDTTNYDLTIMVDGGAGGSIQILDHFYFSNMYRVETLVFDDTSTLNLGTLSAYDIVLTSGDDSYSSGASTALSVYGMVGNDVITTNGGNDILDGGVGNDDLRGQGGNDTYIASIGFDKISDNGGIDTLRIGGSYVLSDLVFSQTYNGQNLLITIPDLGQIEIASQLYSSSYGIEYIHFDSNNTTVALSDVSILQVGTDGGDGLVGVTMGISLNETFDGRKGNDYFYGGYGDDTYLFHAGDGTDIINENPGQGGDKIKLVGLDQDDVRLYTDDHGGLHVVSRANGSDSITASAWTSGYGVSESVIGTYVEQIVFGDDTTLSLTGGLPLEGTNSGDSLYGTAYNDTLTALAGSDSLFGNGGSDTLYGGDDNDYIYGGDGNDVLDGGAGNDLLNGDSGTDTATYANASAAVTVDLSTAYAQNTGGAGTDQLFNFENLTGSAYNDTLTGDGNANVIDGGAGVNTLYGAGGADIFAFDPAVTMNNIQDFSTAQGDKLDISGLIDLYNPLTHAITDFVQITQSGSNSALFVDQDGLGSAYGFTQVGSLYGATGLTDEAALVMAGTLIV